MILFLDTEFTDLEAKDNVLLSLALVREDGNFFYAELPPDEYKYGASLFVRENVLPFLWGGKWIMDRKQIQASLVPWIEGINHQVAICTDAPQFDFEFLKPLLYPWPRNLSKSCLRFNNLAWGPAMQSELLAIEQQYFVDNNCSQHHALHDARALRATAMHAGTFQDG